MDLIRANASAKGAQVSSGTGPRVRRLNCRSHTPRGAIVVSPRDIDYLRALWPEGGRMRAAGSGASPSTWRLGHLGQVGHGRCSLDSRTWRAVSCAVRSVCAESAHSQTEHGIVADAQLSCRRAGWGANVGAVGRWHRDMADFALPDTGHRIRVESYSGCPDSLYRDFHRQLPRR
jgi:hypothetical protein